ncbi:hypothetical protein DFR29_10371 [Tahibacter aquaticus]|uniref:Uncharacterized protein n=1 Tax=Tahibacter aquaticus TaxID=520092 RepID=A0A4R6Z4R6_9GAMM|nr:hypothetical protein [Tahibacter aquaticus]TDR46539.1 hypothetical protein DFR29_10371 [Tahibacter aquaticus]
MLTAPGPFVVCLDTAHWVGLIAALRSAKTRAGTQVRLAAFEAVGGSLALTFHHIVELAQHENRDEVEARFRALGYIAPMCALSGITSDGPGSVLDLIAQELLAALESPDAEAEAIAAAVWPGAVEPASGADFSDWLLPQLDILHWHAAKGTARSRNVSLLSQAAALDRSKEKLMPNARALPTAEVKANLFALGKRLAAEVVQRRDPRASESEAVDGAAQFIRELMGDVEGIADHGNVWEALLARANVSAQEAAGMRYISEVADLGHFRKQLEIPARHLGLTNDELRRVRPEQFPTWLIHLAYTKHRQVAARTQGSDLGDMHLLCHAPYMDALFVDKRTHENVRRIRQKDPRTAVFLQSVQRAGSWDAALDLARTAAASVSG